jgi:hypothetical protein
MCNMKKPKLPREDKGQITFCHTSLLLKNCTIFGKKDLEH